MRHAARVLDWRLLALACLPLAILTCHGKGYNAGTPSLGGPPVASAQVAATFFVLLAVLAASAFVLRRGAGWFLAALIVQSAVLAAAGERLPVLAGAITLVLLLLHAGLRPPRVQVLGAVSLTIIGVLAITAVRAEQGRLVFYSDTA